MWYNNLMKNFEKKEKDLSKLIDRLSNLRTSYSQINDNDDLKAERDTLRTEKKRN